MCYMNAKRRKSYEKGWITQSDGTIKTVCRRCGGDVRANGLCTAHYFQERRHGDPQVRAFIEETEARAEDPLEETPCYWCHARLFSVEGAKMRQPVAWFMDEAICEAHLQLAQRWAKYIEWDRKSR